MALLAGPPALADEVPTRIAPIEDPTGCALERFHRALADPERQGPVRVVHIGDSHVAGDYMTGDVRRRLQARFGIGGPGLTLPGRPWPAHRHTELRFGTTGPWKTIRMNRAEPEDGILGLTGVAQVSEHPGGVLWAESASGLPGAVATHLEVAYVKQPGGGRLAIWIDGRRDTSFSTDSETPQVAYWEAGVTEGAHRVEIRHVAGGPVRVLGVLFERDAGLVYDSLGTNGARLANLDRTHPATFATDLARRAPALVVLAFGTNEMDDEEVPPGDIGAAAIETLHRVRTAAGRASCLVVSPPDRGCEEENGWKTCPRIPLLVDAFRSAALRAGCAFWDQQAAMGGDGSIAAWAQETPPLAARDRVHLTVAGYRLLSEAFATALLQSHDAWLARQTSR